MRHFLTLGDFSKEELLMMLSLAREIKNNPKKFAEKLYHKTLIMMFEKPSLRTRLSFDIGMNQLGGHAIMYDLSGSPLQSGKESIGDTAAVMSRMADIIMVRTFSHDKLIEFSKHSSVPVINGLTNEFHPCQIMGDLLTIYEHLGTFESTVAYYGDCNTNVAHSWMEAAKIFGFKLYLVGPKKKEYCPLPSIMKKTGSHVELIHNVSKVPPTDVVYTDSWMSYHIPKKEQDTRVHDLGEYRVTEEVMSRAKKNALFMHDLPALREMEVETDVIDGEQSVILDQAENRLHAQKGIIWWLFKTP